MSRRQLSRLLVPALVVGAFIASPTTASPAVAQDEYEEVVFRVTLEGPIPPTHTFAVRRQCTERTCVTEDILMLCSPPNEHYAYKPCTAKSYEFTSRIAAGLTVEYSLLRWTTTDLSHTDAQPAEYLSGSWTVREGRQVISLGYVYPTASDAAVDTPVLPDTAASAP